MSDYETAAENAIDNITTNSEGGIVEEYQLADGRRVRRGKATEQIDAAVKLEGLANRRRTGIGRVGKIQEPSS